MFINKNSIMIQYIGTTTGNPSTLGLYEKSGTNFISTADATFQSGKNYYVSMGKYLIEAKYGYNKLWSDGGRNLSGSMTGTLVGIFPKVILQFRKLTESEAELIIPIIDSANQKLTYYDPNKKTMVEMTTYTGDYEMVNKHIVSGTSKNEPFSCSFISVRKRA